MEIEVEPLAGALGVMSTLKINGRCERKTWNNGCLDEQPGLSFDAPLVHHFQGGFSKPSFFSTSSNRVFCSLRHVAGCHNVTRCFVLLGGGIRSIGQANCRGNSWEHLKDNRLGLPEDPPIELQDMVLIYHVLVVVA